MNKYLCFICLSLLIFICAGCSNRAGSGEVGTLIALDKVESKYVFENHLALRSIVPIETTDSCLIGRIRRIILHDKKAYILNDYHEVLIIDVQTGKYLNRVKRQGNGPGEYVRILDMTICDDLNRIVIYSDRMKLLFYDLDLKFIKEQSVDDELYEGITCSGGMLYLYHPMGTSDKNMLAIYDMANDTWTKTGELTSDFNIALAGSPIVKSKSIWHTIPLQNTLSRIQGPSTGIAYRLSMKFGSQEELLGLKNDPQSFFDYVNRNGLNYALTSVRETSKAIYCKSNLYPLILIDKERKTGSYVEPPLYDPRFGASNLQYMAHDGDDDTIMFMLSAEDWVRYKDSFDIPADIQSEMPGRRIDEESNLILVFYSMRE